LAFEVGEGKDGRRQAVDVEVLGWAEQSPARWTV
jgi:hypothetical protein